MIEFNLMQKMVMLEAQNTNCKFNMIQGFVVNNTDFCESLKTVHYLATVKKIFFVGSLANLLAKKYFFNTFRKLCASQHSPFISCTLSRFCYVSIVSTK